MRILVTGSKVVVGQKLFKGTSIERALGVWC
jgi:hypothetical protein